MLQVARRVVACASMDAQQLALRAQSFDVALLAYVLFLCPEPIAALREVHRVLRAPGAIGVVTWGPGAVVPGSATWTEELDALGVAEPPRDAGVAHHALMDTPDKLAALLAEAGFDVESTRRDDFQFRWSARRLVMIHAHFGSAAHRLAGVAPALRAECGRRVHRRLLQLDPVQRVCRLQVVSAVAHKRASAE
jgi:SAM-dependent methyltransferase